LVITRTKQGEALIQEPSKLDVIQTETLLVVDIALMQPYQVQLKKGSVANFVSLPDN
jgi:hypothetical protein